MNKKAGFVAALVLAMPLLVHAQTIPEVKAQIQTLIAQIQTLQAQLTESQTLLARLEAEDALSSEVLNGTWGLGNWTATEGVISSQNGVLTFTENTAHASHGINQYINVPPASIWEISFEAKPVGARFVRAYILDAANQSTVYAAAQCDLSESGAIISKWNSANVKSSATASAVGEGWYRCALRAQLFPSATVSQLRLVLYTDRASGSSQGDGASGLQFRNFALAGKFVGTPPVKATASSDFVQSLFTLREGFGANATGGLDGDVYTVTSLSDSGPGTLRFAAEDPSGKPYWIKFDPALTGGTIALQSPIYVGANRTIDGRGSAITITRYGLEVAGNRDASNVIISNVAVRNLISKENDNISIYGVGVKNVWIHRVSLSGQGSDGLIDVSNGASDITIDWSRFTDHDAVMIVNSYPSAPGENPLANYERDKEARITLHHNLFLGTTQRHPRSVFGKIHLYNNVFKDWGVYGVGSSFRAQTLVEGNLFNTSGQYGSSALLSRVGADPEPGFIKARDNIFMGTAGGSSDGADSVFVPSYQYRCELVTSALENRLIQQAGVEGIDAENAIPFRSACPEIPPPPPTCTLTSNKTTYVYGETILLNWVSSNASSATFVPQTPENVLSLPTGTLGTSGSQSVVAKAAGNHTLALKAVSSSGAAVTCNATISIQPAPSWQSLNSSLVAWAPLQATLSSVDGVTTLVENTSSVSHRMEQYITTPSITGPVRFSFEISPVGARGVRVYVLNTNRQSDQYIASNFTLTGNGGSSKWKGALTSGNDTTITRLPDGWYQVTMLGTLGQDPITKLRLVIGAEVNGSEGYAGDGVSGLKVRNVNLERQKIETVMSDQVHTLASAYTALSQALDFLKTLVR